MPVEKGWKISVSWFEKGGLLTRKSRQAAFLGKFDMSNAGLWP